MVIIREYEADFGTHYVQAVMNDIRLELSFDHKPTYDEVLEIMTEYTKPQEEVVELVAENGATA